MFYAPSHGAPLKRTAEFSTHPAASIPVAIYTRVSTTSQVGGRFDSCESQAGICRDYITRHASEGWHEIACYTDAAYSGSNMNRPGINALKAQIASGAVKVVVIFKLERMLRSTDEWAPFRAFLQQHGCRLVSTSEDLTEDTPSGRLKNNIMVSVAEYERLNTAEKVRAKMLEQAKRGYWNCGLIPFGYSYDAKTQLLHPDPTEAPLVRRIFEDAAQLVPLNTLVDRLTAEGRRTRVRNWTSRHGESYPVGGGAFRTDIVRAMLRNPIYSGYVRFRKKEYPGKHEAIVSRELWEQANAAVASPGRLQRDPFRSSNVHGFFLKGLVQCSHCQRALMPWTSSPRGEDKKVFRYYRCGTFNREEGKERCPIRAIQAASLEAAVVGYLGGIVNHPELLHRAVEDSRARNVRDRVPLQEKLVRLDQEIAALGRQIRNCVDAVAQGGTDSFADELRDRARDLQDRKRELTVEHERARQELSACDQERVGDDRIRNALSRFGEVFPELDSPERARLMQLCFDRIDVTAKAAGASGVRQLQLALRVPVARLVEGMEAKMVIDHRGAHGARLERRRLTLPVTVAMERSGLASIRRPFALSLEPRQLEIPGKPRRDCLHPLHRALEWEKLRAKRPDQAMKDFAVEQQVTQTLIYYHFGLLRLAPEIQAFLLALKDRESVRRFGMIPLLPLAKLDHAAQLRQFALLTSGRFAAPATVATTPAAARLRSAPKTAA
jgi:DNA invertase Pin-like site-specific DNA recombinase